MVSHMLIFVCHFHFRLRSSQEQHIFQHWTILDELEGKKQEQKSGGTALSLLFVIMLIKTI
jgi:ABC-type long-subunit fatty acid transport system fused permease/ATPase subunit